MTYDQWKLASPDDERQRREWAPACDACDDVGCPECCDTEPVTMDDHEMEAALMADGEKLRQLTGEDHGPFASETDRSVTFCDCCEKPFPRDQVSHCWVTGIETFACDNCRGIA